MAIQSLRTKILVIIFSIIAVEGAVFFLFSIINTKNYKSLNLKNIERLVMYETEIVNKKILEIEQGAIFYAIDGNLCYEAQSEEMGDELAAEYLNALSIAVGGGFWFEPYAFKKDQQRAGFYAYREKKSGEIVKDETFLMDEYDYHDKNWYKDIIGSIEKPYQVVWTRPYVDDSGSFSLMTTAGAGIFDQSGVLIAISTVDWEIDEVISELISVKPTEKSNIILCVPQENYIISSTFSENMLGASIESIPWDINAYFYKYKGVNYYNFNRNMDNGWLLSVQIPENEIIADVVKQNRLFTVHIVLSAVLLLLAAFLVISRYINNPIKQLTEEVSKIELGNLDMHLKIRSNDELGQFAKVLNSMTIDLKKSIEENMKVREKTDRINTELNVAKNIQANILPGKFPPFPDRNEFDIFASMLPAREVGGDLYDFFFVDNDNLVVVIADVSGKGVPAALFMVIAKTLIKNCSFCRNPKMLMETVNKKLCEGNDSCIFVTAFIGFYNLKTGRFSFVNAGHNPPLLKKQGKAFEFLKTEPCIVLAFSKDAQYRVEEIFLEKGDVLYLYTDGVTESMNREREMFGETQLLETVNQFSGSPPKELLRHVKENVDKFADGFEQADDITMLALKISETEEIETLKAEPA